ncbi:MAG: NAD(P)H-dependent glycerol-3-phosphate dehydrogenase [Candidatus Zixiibacteriota bacterium]
MPDKVAILGAGSWGLALASMLNRSGHRVSVWEFDRDDACALAETRRREDKLPGVLLPDSITVTNDIDEAITIASLVVIALPSQTVRSALKWLSKGTVGEAGIVNLAKGVETRTLLRMSEVIAEELALPGDRIVTLSGPSHAEEVVRDMPTAVVAAGSSEMLVRQVQETFSTRVFRVYQSDDIVGVELGGSLKNVIAIASGIIDGLGMGDNTRGALLTRGLAEITRLGLAAGARADTFGGLSGLGDLVTTCISRHSRNRFVGEQIGRGRNLNEILADMTMVAEGVQTTRSACDMARVHNVEMPIANEVHKVLFENKQPAEALSQLMERKLKAEVWR